MFGKLVIQLINKNIAMKKKFVCMLVTCLAVFSTAFGQQEVSRLCVEPKGPIAGQVLNLIYNPAGGPLEGRSNLVGIVYLYNFYHWDIADIQLVKDGNLWKGTFKIPDNCGFIAFKFQSTFTLQPDRTDNNDDKGFMYIVKNEQGRVVPGGHLAWGIFRMPSLGEGVTGYWDKGHKGISDEAIMMWLDKETRLNPQYGRHFFGVMKSVFKKIYGEDSRPGIVHLLKTMETQPNLTEDEYQTISNTYRFDLKNKEKADSLERVILELFPRGHLARRQHADALRGLSETDYFVAAERFMKEFPITEWYKNPNSQGFVYFNFYKDLASRYYKSNNYKKLEEILPGLNMFILNEVFHRSVEYSIKKLPTPAENYVAFSKKLIEQMFDKVKDGSYAYMRVNNSSPRQAEAFARLYLNYNVAVHAQIAEKAGRYEEAVNMMNMLGENERYNFYPAGNEAYVTCLEKLGRKSEAIDAMIGMARVSKMTPLIYDKLKAYYDGLKKRKKPAATFEAWIASLRSPEEVEKIKNKLREKIIDIPYESFVLESHDGGVIDSKNFGEDDIVVLDFWALWCAPCIAALDGMQMAVDLYANDPTVKFYFVITQDEPNREKIDALWKKNDFRNMEVLYDANPKGKNSRNVVYKSMFPGTSGIPQKAILKNGHIRYRAEGYGGSPSGLMDEISYVIEILKEEGNHVEK